jgi:ABC-2 type transport system permease protein
MKEILRDPLNLCFGLGFPLVLLLLMTAIQKNIPIEMFTLDKLTPGMAVFGLAFMTLFAASLVSGDRASSFIRRLYSTPMTAAEYIAGYALPIIPIALGQTVICYLAAIILGLKASVNVVYAVLLSVPEGIFFISLGVFCGCVLNEKQVGGICGALLTNLTVWLSGIFFDLDLVGGAFKKIAYALPFVHGVELEKIALTRDFAGIGSHLIWVLGYMVIFAVLASFAVKLRMKRE